MPFALAAANRWLWVSLLLLAATTASAEGDGIVHQRVRLRLLASDEAVLGKALAVTRERVTIEGSDPDTRREIDWRDVKGLELSRGKKRNTSKGVLGGVVLWGAIVGAIAAFDTLDESGVAEPVFIGVLLGAGGYVGHRIQTEKWERVPIPSAEAETR